jgi:hypothetical protein
MADSPDGRCNLAAEDEVLQVMYWLRGEGLAADVTPADVARFTGSTEGAVVAVLERLVERGFVAPVLADVERRFVLTHEGGREGGRRFADEFADLTKPGHGECSDPDCECRRTGNVADCRHR